jgi:acid phosphatase
MKRRTLFAAASVVGLVAMAVPGTAQAGDRHDDPLQKVKHIVVIYEENHSFDNLYGTWEGVDGLKKAPKAKTVQVNQGGQPYDCLLQKDVNLTSPTPLATTCTDTTTGASLASAFANKPFDITDYIAPTDTTCPAPGVFAANGVLKGSGQPGGCTRDIVHRYYQEQYQIDGGKQDRYTTGSDAAGLTQGYYDTRSLPIYQYLHGDGAPNYVIADRFFQAAFGGSYLNHQWLVAAATPTFAGALNDGSADDLHSVVDKNGMPNNYPLYTSPLGSAARDLALTASCAPPAGRPATPAGAACGDYSINTIQPTYQPYAPGTAAARRLPPLTNPTIGDELSARNVSWAWYSGGWSNADGRVGEPGWTNGTGPACADPATATGATYPNCPDKLFQYHHQAFNYYASFAPGTAAREAHLRDEKEFMKAAQAGTLKAVSFVKPLGEENEHPGYASETAGSSHLVDLIKAIENGPDGKNTMIIITYDEFGGQWDHVSPPMGPKATKRGVADQWGPGTRIPALVISKQLPEDYAVDHVSHDTTSILATIEHRFDLAPLTSRDASVADLSSAFHARTVEDGHGHR